MRSTSACIVSLVAIAASLSFTPGCAEGPPGQDGLACWDLDGDGTGDPQTEDTNGDGVVNVEDCRGADGKTALMVITDDLDGVCPNGGKKISTGVDDNGDGVLDPDEIDRTEYFCFDPGGGGGLNSLVAVVDEPPGANCPAGGKRIESGLDSNSNGILDPAEVDQVSYLCGGKLTAVIGEPAGANCANGGLRVATGSDDDGDGVLQAGEEDTVEYVCHGADGVDGTSGAESLVTVTPEPAGTNCSAGGSLVRSGTDDNGNGVLDAAEVDHSAFVCAGDAAAAALVRVDPEPAGPNCASGVSAIFAGVDVNGNGTLDAGEITYTSYVCNGAAGSSGSTGSDALIRLEVEPIGANCSEGGVAIHAGVDLNGNGILDAGEETSTQYLCHGQDGTAYQCDEGEIRYVVCGPSNSWEQRQVCDSLNNWIDVGGCEAPGGGGGGSCPAVSLGITEITSAAPAFTCLFRSTVIYNGEIWVIDGNVPHHSPDGINWTTEAAAPFSDRCYHAAVVHGTKIYVMGGWISGNGSYPQDVWSYEAGVGWTQEQAAAPFGGRLGPAAVSFGGGIYLFGGYQGSNTHEDVWFSTDGQSWTQVTEVAPFGERSGPMATTWNGSLWLSGSPNDVWRSPDGQQWVQETVGAGWAGRSRASLLVHAGLLWVMGGHYYDDIWYSSDGQTWCEAAENLSIFALSSSTPPTASVDFGGKIYVVTSFGRVYTISVL